MAVEKITASDSVLGNYQARAASEAALQSERTQATPPDASQVVNALQENELLITDTLRTAGSASSGSTQRVLFDTRSPFLTALQTVLELNPFQQNALLVNRTLQTLNFAGSDPANSLIIDELSPALQALGITEQLDLIEQNGLRVNETLLQLGSESTLPVGGTFLPGAVPQFIATEGETNSGQLTATPPQNTSSTPTETALTTSIPEESTVQGIAPDSVRTNPATETTVPASARFLTQELTPTALPLSLISPDRTPYVVAVYQTNNPAPPPDTPQPISKTVPPATAATMSRPVGSNLYRQTLRLAQERDQTKQSDNTADLTTIAQAEKSIRLNLDHVNEDMSAHGLPLHLVFAKHENGYALDVYDCSYYETCRLSYDIPFDLDNLTDVLGNLQTETGIIVDTTS